MELLGAVAAILTTISFIPQAVKTIKTQNTEGLSLVMYLCLTLGIFLWSIYGLLTHDRPVFLANAITLIFVLIILSILIKNKLKKST